MIKTKIPVKDKTKQIPRQLFFKENANPHIQHSSLIALSLLGFKSVIHIHVQGKVTITTGEFILSMKYTW